MSGDAYRFNTTIPLSPQHEPKLTCHSHTTNEQKMADAFDVTKASELLRFTENAMSK